MGRQSNLTMEQRTEAVLSLLRREEPADKIARRYGIAEPTLWGDDLANDPGLVHVVVLERLGRKAMPGEFNGLPSPGPLPGRERESLRLRRFRGPPPSVLRFARDFGSHVSAGGGNA